MSALLTRLGAATGFLLRWSLRALWMLGVQMVIVAFVALLWLSLSTSAPGWLWTQLAPRVPELTISGISGRFATGLGIAELRWQNETQRLLLQDVQLRWQAVDLLQGRISLDQARVGVASLQMLRDTPPEPLTLPELDLPLAWFVRDLRLDEFRWQPVSGAAVVLQDLHLVGEGAGTRVTVTDLSLRHALGSASLAGHLDTSAYWPMNLTLVVTPEAKVWPTQRITVQGDLSALRLRARGPRQWPLDLAVTADVRPVMPSFSGQLSWPRWQPAGQKDWRLEAGALRFRGTQASGEAVLALRAIPLNNGALPWPAGWPRQAELAGPLRWQTDGDGQRARVDWRGRFGSMPWLVSGAIDSTSLGRTRLDMQLAEARLRISGWPDAKGLSGELQVPRLQRFQSQLSGAASLRGAWRGTLPAGRGELTLQARQWQQGETLLLDRLQVVMSGGLAAQRWQLDGRRGGITARLGLQGSLDLAARRWTGELRQGRVEMANGVWQLRAPAAMSLSPTRNVLAEQCWQQSPWQVCARADLLPELWTARVRADSGAHGSLLATLRRDPRQANPALDADLVVDDVDLARLPVSLPPGMNLEGEAHARAHLGGTLAAPTLTGDFGLRDGALQMPAYGLDWRPLKLQGRLLGDHIDWRGEVRDGDGGSATLSGNARLQPTFQLQARLVGKDLRVGYAPWATGHIQPDITLELRQQHAIVRGQVTVPDAVITLRQPESAALAPSGDVRIVRDRAGRVPKQPGEVTAGLPLDLALAITLGDKVRITGMGLASRLQGHLLLVQKPEVALSSSGELRLSDDAIYEAYGQRLQIRSGRFLFAGPVTRPNINLEAVRTVDDVVVGVRLTGRAQSPQAELFSDEPMAQEEILSMLVLGRSLSNTTAPTAAQRQALALGAALKLGGRTGAFDKLGQRLGISDFALGTEGDSDQTRVAVSGYVRPDLYLSFGMGVFEPTQSLKMRYQMNKRLSLEAVTSLQSAITLFYSWRF